MIDAGLLDQRHRRKAIVHSQGLSSGRHGVVRSPILSGYFTGTRSSRTRSSLDRRRGWPRFSSSCHRHRSHGRGRSNSSAHHAFHVNEFISSYFLILDFSWLIPHWVKINSALQDMMIALAIYLHFVLSLVEERLPSTPLGDFPFQPGIVHKS